MRSITCPELRKLLDVTTIFTHGDIHARCRKIRPPIVDTRALLAGRITLRLTVISAPPEWWIHHAAQRPMAALMIHFTMGVNRVRLYLSPTLRIASACVG